MNHINIDLDAIYHSPLSCKIMGIIFIKNFGIGLYKGIKDFTAFQISNAHYFYIK